MAAVSIFGGTVQLPVRPRGMVFQGFYVPERGGYGQSVSDCVVSRAYCPVLVVHKVNNDE